MSEQSKHAARHALITYAAQLPDTCAIGWDPETISMLLIKDLLVVLRDDCDQGSVTQALTQP